MSPSSELFLVPDPLDFTKQPNHVVVPKKSVVLQSRLMVTVTRDQTLTASCVIAQATWITADSAAVRHLLKA